jgi:hypothetical protein
MAMRKVQLYLSEEQYRLLKQRAESSGSIAQAVRILIDESTVPKDPTSDPFYRHVMSRKKRGGRSFDAEQAKRDLYKQPR